MRVLSAAMLPLGAAMLLTGCGHSEYRSDKGMVWHTTYHITYDSERELGDSIIATLDSVGRSLNVFDPESLASRVNASDSVAVDAAYAEVYETSVRVNRLTDGAFDPTLGPLITAWGFGKGHKATADTLRIDSLMAFTGISRTRLENGMIIKEDPRIEFNYSAIAKGYGCDRVAATLARNGAENYLVEIGGEIRCAGKSPSGKGWRISIDRPVKSAKPGAESQCIVEITDAGLATSGNYRNYHAASGGETYGHTISAKTGRPVQTDVLSATVIAPTTMEADALATSMMALGSGDAKKLAEELGLPVMLVLADMSVWQSPQFTSLAVGEP